MIGDHFAYHVWALDREMAGLRRALTQLQAHLEALGPRLIGGPTEDPEEYLRAYV